LVGVKKILGFESLMLGKIWIIEILSEVGVSNEIKQAAQGNGDEK
jgi:hypothetical protein